LKYRDLPVLNLPRRGCQGGVLSRDLSNFLIFQYDCGMQVLRRSTKGKDVKRWQFFLIGQKFHPGEVDGDFGKQTEDATKEFQRHHSLDVDGVVGNQTLGTAMLLGFVAVEEEADTSTTGPNFPPKPDFAPLTGNPARQQVFGKFVFKHKPLPSNPENIVITDSWEQDNIVRIPIAALKGVPGASFDGGVRFHKLAQQQLIDLWAAWQKAKLLHLLVTFDGAFVPRFIRGSTTVLSNHAFGSAFDINASFNSLGAEPALVGRKGSVREMVEIANDHGFYWGGHFQRLDGMHFEVAQLA